MYEGFGTARDQSEVLYVLMSRYVWRKEWPKAARRRGAHLGEQGAHPLRDVVDYACRRGLGLDSIACVGGVHVSDICRLLDEGGEEARRLAEYVWLAIRSAPVAQWSEHTPYKRGVTGSSPVWRTERP